MMTSSNNNSLPRVALLVLVLSLVLLPCAGRVGSKKQQFQKDKLRPVSRKLQGNYKGRHNNRGDRPKRNNHYGYYYIKREVDPCEYYGNCSGSASGDSEDVVARTDIPVSQPTLAPVPPPTEAPVSPPTEAPVPPPTEAPVSPPPPTEAPAIPPVTPPTDAPEVEVELVVPDEPEVELVVPDEEDLEVDIEFESDQQEIITLEPPTEIQARISKFALGGGSEFQDPSSYQSIALKRVEQQVGSDTFSDVKLMQYYALYSIFAATNSQTNDFIIQARAFGDFLGKGEGDEIPGWKITSGWLENDVDPCVGEWYGIGCVEDQITTIDLFDNGLTGNFPPEVALLASEDGTYSTGAGSLVSLDIFNNNLMSNNGDSTWISDMGSQLGYLYLQNTVFSGTLPSKFPNGLVELDIANSLITGSLDGAAFEDLTSLKFLLIDGVQFDSSIPSEIATLPNLEYLFATDSMITGDLSYMENMPVIFEHWIDRNPLLGGTIPTTLGLLTTLQSFSIAECAFTGTIPETLGNLGLMQQMWLYGNELTGEIPASLGNLSFLKILEVEGNNLSDSMPQSICDNFQQGMLEVLGGDCDKIDCPCCTCCSVEECRE